MDALSERYYSQKYLLLEVKDRLDILRGVVVFLQKTTTFEKKFREVKKDIVLHMTIFFVELFLIISKITQSI